MTASSTNAALLVARVLLGLLFVMAGIGKLADVQGFGVFMATGGIPAALAWPVVLFEIIAGLMLIAGLFTRATAWALAAFCVASGALYHFDPADQMQMTQLLKNLALAGGYVALSISGAGAYSLDARRGSGFAAANA
ncbi:DoxX family protein [Cognatishimia sp. F0-27]|uniref:DoxX family protein n=1 Tax=Cognatishimia sp. F0-27 TaxID=2816855 RepID=UPI001D0C9BFF|nr:DoxX family protein [Cognatishimia sp. F0-27]MCC1491883.1 DoxX family protein [Cognatishimia sp. F0-27]